MKKKFLTILTISFVITTIGFIMDGDAKVPSMMLRFTEFLLMLGILFLLLSGLYFGSLFIKRRFQKLIN